MGRNRGKVPTHILWFESLDDEVVALCMGSSDECAQVRNAMLVDVKDPRIRNKYGIFTRLANSRFSHHRHLMSANLPLATDVLLNIQARKVAELNRGVQWDFIRQGFSLAARQRKGEDVEIPSIAMAHQIEVIELYVKGDLTRR